MSAQSDLILPTPQQIAWQDLEFGMFCHFGLNTFVDLEWGDGQQSPTMFDPESFDADQWVDAARQAGMKYLIPTAKHHGGFCLWPTATTQYGVQSSPWRGGQRDVVKEVSEACERGGIKFGVYLSPWDRNAECYADEEAYDDFYVRQLTELLTNYGEIFEVWLDGAGSAGHRYDQERIMQCIYRHQPDAMVFNMGKPTIRWVGNESGLAPYPCWNVVKPEPPEFLLEEFASQLQWCPAECDVPIRKGWFWHPDNLDTLKSLEHLLDIYYRSVGHGAGLILNVAPDTRGLLPEEDVTRLHELGGEIHRRFATPLAATAGQGPQVSLQLPEPTGVNHAVLQEDLACGERVREWVVEALREGKWHSIYEGSAIRHKHIASFPDVVAEQFRLRITESIATPIIRSFSLFRVSGFIPRPRADTD